MCTLILRKSFLRYAALYCCCHLSFLGHLFHFICIIFVHLRYTDFFISLCPFLHPLVRKTRFECIEVAYDKTNETSNILFKL